MSYKFTITKTYHYYGYPQKEEHFTIKGEFFTATVKYFGNQGFDAPIINCNRKCNGYFWSMHSFMQAFYAGKLRSIFFNLKVNEPTTITTE